MADYDQAGNKRGRPSADNKHAIDLGQRLVKREFPVGIEIGKKRKLLFVPAFFRKARLTNLLRVEDLNRSGFGGIVTQVPADEINLQSVRQAGVHDDTKPLASKFTA